MEITYTPDAYLGKEPSLNQLIDWFDNVTHEDSDLTLSDEGITNDILDVLTVYKQEANLSYSSGMYYLYGQIQTSPDDPITYEKLQEALEEPNKRFREYGGPCNSFEAASIERSRRDFSNLQRLLQFYYYDYPDEICYRPGGKGYVEAYAEFISRNPPSPP